MSAAENFVDLSRQLEIQLADAANTVGIQIDHHLIPHVKPLRMVIHRFRNQRHASHVSKSGHEILALERAMQLAALQCPASRLTQALFDFHFSEFFCSHLGSPMLEVCGDSNTHGKPPERIYGL